MVPMSVAERQAKFLAPKKRAFSLMTQSMHASVRPGYTCADCSIDDEPCPACYAAAWRLRHPDHVTVG